MNLIEWNPSSLSRYPAQYFCFRIGCTAQEDHWWQAWSSDPKGRSRSFFLLGPLFGLLGTFLCRIHTFLPEIDSLLAGLEPELGAFPRHVLSLLLDLLDKRQGITP
jgi:hypothetical protein